MASAGSFRFQVLVGMKGIPAHARLKVTARIILGSSCARVDTTNPEALEDPDDERELFVAAWCAHPDLIPDEKIMAVPELEEHDVGSLVYLRPHEIIHDEVPVLRYLVRIRIIKFRDWHTPPPSSDDDYDIDGDEDSDDSNYGFHPGFSSGGGGTRPRTTCFGGASEPQLGRGSGPAFRAREPRGSFMVGDVTCPILTSRGAMPCHGLGRRIPAAQATHAEAPRSAMPCHGSGSGTTAAHGTHVGASVAQHVDFALMRTNSPSPVKAPASDPMLMEAALCTPRNGVSACETRVHSIDVWPRVSRSDPELMAGRVACFLSGMYDGPDTLCRPGFDLQLQMTNSASVQAVDLCLSSPEVYGSGPTSPKQPSIPLGQVKVPPVVTLDGIDGTAEQPDAHVVGSQVRVGEQRRHRGSVQRPRHAAARRRTFDVGRGLRQHFHEP